MNAPDSQHDDTVEVSTDDTVPVLPRTAQVRHRNESQALPVADEPRSGPGLLPVVYGARDLTAESALHADVDEVELMFGRAPEASFVEVREGREKLIATVRREQRRRVFTLVALGAVVCLAVAGLWAISQLVF